MVATYTGHQSVLERMYDKFFFLQTLLRSELADALESSLRGDER